MSKVIPLLSDAASATTGTITLTSGAKFGGFDMSTDGTNSGTIVIRNDSATGRILINSDSAFGKVLIAPIPSSNTIYYSISGTNATVQLFEWRD